MYSQKLRKHIEYSKTAAAANKAKGNRHVEILASLYSDTSRFIEELLQNANDACLRNKLEQGSGKVKFVLLNDRLILYHNGILFDEKDLISITTIGQSTKTGMSDVNMIGKFGLGFKSVFAVCNEPEIHSGNFHFKIRDYEVLAETKAVSDEGFGTCIILPFKDDQHVHSIVSEGLDKIGWQHLLFAQGYHHIEIVQSGISKTISRTKITAFGNNIQHIRINNDFFLKFIPDKKKDSPVFAFKTDTDLRGNLTFTECPYENTFVHYPTLFPSGLNFLIHATFTTTPTREQIPFGQQKTPENIFLLEKITETISLLPSLLIKHRILHPSFWEITPVFNTVIPENPIQEAVCKGLREAIRTQNILPSTDGRYCSIKDLCVAPEKISALFPKNEFLTLFGRKHVLCYELSKRFQSDNDLRSRFKEIKYIDIQDFAFAVGNHPEILNNKKPTFHISFLKIIAEHPELWISKSNVWYNILEKPFILSSAGKVVAPFQNGEPEIFIGNTRNKQFRTVHNDLIQDKYVLDFLKKIGIPDADELIEFDHLILKVFKSGSPGMKKVAVALENLFLMLAHCSEISGMRMIAALSKTKCIPATSFNGGKKILAQPQDVYFPLSNVFQFFQEHNISIVDKEIITSLISKGIDQSKVYEIFHQLGVNDKPAFVVFEQAERAEELKNETLKIENTGLTVKTFSFSDVDIDGLDQFLQFPSLQKSLIVASLLSGEYPKATIQFETYTQKITKELTPFFLQKLSVCPWLYDTHGNLSPSADISVLHPAYGEAGIDILKLEKVIGHQFQAVKITPEETAIILKIRALKKTDPDQLDISTLMKLTEQDFPDMKKVNPFFIDLRENPSGSIQTPFSKEGAIPDFEQVLRAHISFHTNDQGWFFLNPFQIRAMEVAVKALQRQDSALIIQKTSVPHIVEITNNNTLRVFAAISGIKAAPGIFIFPLHQQDSPEVSQFITIDNMLSEHPVVSVRNAEDPGIEIKGFILRKS